MRVLNHRSYLEKIVLLIFESNYTVFCRCLGNVEDALECFIVSLYLYKNTGIQD